MLFARRHVTEKGVFRQTLSEHCKRVSRITADTCKMAGLEKLGELAGLIHDMPKSYFAWQNYLENGGETVFHAPYTAEFIERCFGDIKAPCADLTRQMLALACRGHHGGLHDVLTPSGERDLPCCSAYSSEETVSADKSFFMEVAPKAALAELFLKACNEVSSSLELAVAVSNEPKATPFEREPFCNEAMLYMGLAERLLYCALIDADRLDAACWESWEEIPENPLPDWGAKLSKLEARLKGFNKTKISELITGWQSACPRLSC